MYQMLVGIFRLLSERERIVTPTYVSYLPISLLTDVAFAVKLHILAVEHKGLSSLANSKACFGTASGPVSCTVELGYNVMKGAEYFLSL
jgi:hypothetical protein